MKKKLVLVLALCQDAQARYRKQLTDYIVFFSKNQGAFMGRKHTYKAAEERFVSNEEEKKKYESVVTTPTLKFQYFIESAEEYVKALLSKERTNASGVAKAHLIVDGKDWGEFFSNELLALKGVIESGDMLNLLTSIPVRSDTIAWEKSSEFPEMDVWCEIKINTDKTTDKTPFILEDPNIEKIKTLDYKPQVVYRDTLVTQGVLTREEYHSGWKTAEKAATLDRRTILLAAITTALSQCNDCEVVETTMTADKLFGYIFFGSNQ